MAVHKTLVQMVGQGMTRDFLWRRYRFMPGSVSSVTLVAGMDYLPPMSAARGFVRSMPHQNSTATSAGVVFMITNPENIMTSLTFERPNSASSSEVVFEILEYIGISGGPNEWVVRHHEALDYGTTNLTVDSSPVSGVVSDSKVFTLVTSCGLGDALSSAVGDSSMGLSSSEWVAASQVARCTRDAAGTAGMADGGVSVAVIELTGSNWSVQEQEFAVSVIRDAENFTISPALPSVAKTMIFEERRIADDGLNTAVPYDTYIVPRITSTTNFEITCGNGEQSDQLTVRVKFLMNSADDFHVDWATGTWAPSGSGGTDELAIATTGITEAHNAMFSYWGDANNVGGSESATAYGLEGAYVQYMESTGVNELTVARKTVPASQEMVYSLQSVQWPGDGVRTDFRVQRFFVGVPAGDTSKSFNANVNYTPPADAGRAFVRVIRRAHHATYVREPAYSSSVVGSVQATAPASSTHPWITHATDITDSFTLNVGVTAVSVSGSWEVEIIEYVGEPGGANEMIVRGVGTITQGAAGSATNDSATIGSIADDTMVVPWLTGLGLGTSAIFNNSDDMLATLEWVGGGTDVVRATRFGTSVESILSYALIEFTGSNWSAVNPVEGTVATVNVDTTVSIGATISGLTKTFAHRQTRLASGLPNDAEEQGNVGWITSATEVTLRHGGNSNAGSNRIYKRMHLVSFDASVVDDPLVVEAIGETNSAASGNDIVVAALSTLADKYPQTMFVVGEGGTSEASSATDYLSYVCPYWLLLGGENDVLIGRQVSTQTFNYRGEVVLLPGALVGTGSGGGGGVGRLVNGGLVRI